MSQATLDSIQIWQQSRNFKAILKEAKNLESHYASVPPCVKMTLLLAASKAAIDLYQPEDCLQFAQKAGEIPFSKCPDSTQIMEALLYEAIALNMLEHPQKEKSVSLTEQVIYFGEQHQNADLLIRAYTHLGMMLNKSGAFGKARDTFLKGHKIAQNYPDLRRKATSFANIALCDLNLKQYQQGLTMIDSAILFTREINLPPLLAHCYGLKAALYDGLGDEQGWAAALEKAIQISTTIGNLNQAAMGMADRLNHFVEKGQFEKAIASGMDALTILEKTDQFPQVSKNVYKGLFKAYQGIGNHSKANKYLEKYVTLKDSLENAAFEKQVYELNLKYEIQEKDNELLQQKLDLKNSRIIIISALAGIAILSILAFFIFWRNNYQKQIIAAQFLRERELEKENQRLRKLYQPPTPPDAVSREAQQEENLTKQLYLNACHIIEEQQLFLDPEFDLVELVKRLNTNRSYLSQAINQYNEDGFRSFLNKYRVQYAKNILWAIASNMKSAIPFAEVWKYSGMNSNQSFYRIFKALTGLTPKEYLDQVKLELSSPPAKDVPEVENYTD